MASGGQAEAEPPGPSPTASGAARARSGRKGILPGRHARCPGIAGAGGA